MTDQRQKEVSAIVFHVRLCPGLPEHDSLDDRRRSINGSAQEKAQIFIVPGTKSDSHVIVEGAVVPYLPMTVLQYNAAHHSNNYIEAPLNCV